MKFTPSGTFFVPDRCTLISWLVFRPDATIEQRARAQAWLEARQAALQGELLATARQNAAREITRLLELLGFEQAQVGWQTAQAN